MLTLNIYQTLAVAVVALWTGSLLRHKLPILVHFCIPAPVIGGLLFALLSLCCHLFGGLTFKIDYSIEEVCMVFFFTSVGFQANIKTLRKGGRPLIALLTLITVVIVIQNLASIGVANVMGLNSLTGMTAGSIPMVGGHGTAGAFGPVL